MAVKRRTIWMSDEEWAILGRYAADSGETISGAIRGFWRRDAERNQRPMLAALLEENDGLEQRRPPETDPKRIEWKRPPFTPAPKKGR